MVKSSADYMSKGYLDARSVDSFRRIEDIAATFGVPLNAIRRGFQFKGAALWPGRERVLLWWPKPDSLRKESDPWHNEPSEDGGEIREWHRDQAKTLEHIEACAEEDCTRPTFICERDKDFGYHYRYVGVFKMDVEASRTEGRVVWKRMPGSERLDLR